MERLKERHSADVHRRALGVLWIQLMARAQTAPLADEVKAERERIRAAAEAHEEAVMRRMAATSVIYYVDSLLDAEVRRLSLAALAFVEGDRGRSTYANLFNTPPGDAMRPVASSEQATYVRRLISVLELGGDYAPLDRFIAPLTAAQAEVDAAVAAREGRYAEESRAQTQLAMICEDARRLYNGFHPRLAIMFPEQERLVDSFFADL
jgi:hypothetical protein